MSRSISGKATGKDSIRYRNVAIPFIVTESVQFGRKLDSSSVRERGLCPSPGTFLSRPKADMEESVNCVVEDFQHRGRHGEEKVNECRGVIDVIGNE